MWHLREPTPDAIRAFLGRQAGEPFSYPAVGATRREPVAAPPGFDLDHNRVRLGDGRAVFVAARAALARWEMFPAPWARIEPGFRLDPEAGPPPLRESTVVAIVARAFGLWWLSACRVVDTIDASDRALERCRGHELVHVRQAERWGPLFLPAYLAAALWARLRGRHPYRDNPFEVEARERGGG